MAGAAVKGATLFGHERALAAFSYGGAQHGFSLFLLECKLFANFIE
jgi:hypothetical protein